MRILAVIFSGLLAITSAGPSVAQQVVAKPKGASNAQLLALTERAVSDHILPGYGKLVLAGAALEKAARADCSSQSATLRQAYHDMFDAWLGVSHLRFGPSEEEDRAFAMAFWPDTKGFTPKALSRMILEQDQVVGDAAAYGAVSIAARGLFALEFMLFDDRMMGLGEAGYRCALIRAIAIDAHRIARDMRAGWVGGYADILIKPGPGLTYRTPKETAQEVFKALSMGLQFTSDSRLGRPLGTFDRPRPRRAEARRSGRSLRNVVRSLEVLEGLAMILSEGHAASQAKFARAFSQARAVARDLNDPVFAGVADVQGRLRVEILQQSIDEIRTVMSEDLGPYLGVAAGFNALDGD